MPIVRSVPAEHQPFIRTALVILATLAASVATAALDIVDQLPAPAPPQDPPAPTPTPTPAPAPAPAPAPGPVELASDGVPESVLVQAIAATQTQLLLGNPNEPGAGRFVGDTFSLRLAVIEELRARAIRVIGYPIPTVQSQPPPTPEVLRTILPAALTGMGWFSPFTEAQIDAFVGVLSAAMAGAP